MAFRVATFNCNGLRARLDLLLPWLDRWQPTVLALQETKCPDDQFPREPFERAGWVPTFRGEKGYNGVAMLTRTVPHAASFGLGDDAGESETRLACIRLGDVHVLNTYVPQGQALDSERFAFKLQWLSRVKAYLDARFDPQRDKLAWVGDLNIAPAPGDVYDSAALWPNVCHCQPTTDAFADLLAWGLVDVVRKHRPQEGTFTFWDYRLPRGVERNLGWRLDHVLATPPLADRSIECTVDLEPRRAERPSDHTVVIADFGE